MTEPPLEPAKFGWCLTRQHRDCVETITDPPGKTRHCGCPCHHHPKENA